MAVHCVRFLLQKGGTYWSALFAFWVRCVLVVSSPMAGMFRIGGVSERWIESLVSIDATWNPSSWSRALFERELVNPCARIRGLFSGKDLVGYLIGHIVFDEAHIVSLGIVAGFRMRGGGQMLLDDFIRICKMERVVRLTLQVRVSNHSARKLYLKNGMLDLGVRKRYYSDNGEDAITMGVVFDSTKYVE